jgi:cytochrome c oxidase subunit 4
LGDLGLPVALVIATAKAVLVVVFFMELFLERATARLALLASVTLVVLLLLLTVGDVLTRGAPPLDAPPGAAHRDRG